MKIKLGDIFEIGSGGTPSKSHSEYYGGSIPWVKTGDLRTTYLYNVEDFITEEGLNNSSAKMYEPDTVLIAMYGATIGATSILKISACTNQACAAFKPNERVRPEYLYYFLRSKKEKFVKDGVGGAQPNISAGYLKNVEMDLIPMERQDEIVAIMTKVSMVIEKRKQEIQQLDDLIKARFVELFGSLNDNKNGLDIVTIEELCTLIKDGTHQTPTYTEDTQNGFKFLSSKDVMTQKICWDDIKYILAELHEKLYATIQPQRNDILMSKNGVNYGVAAVNDTDEVFDIYVSLALLRPRTDRVNPVYLRCAINNPDTKRQFDSSIKGIGVPNLHLGEIKKTKILLPPIGRQNEFVTFVEQTDKSKVIDINITPKGGVFNGNELFVS